MRNRISIPVCLFWITLLSVSGGIAVAQDFLREPKPLAPGVLMVVPAELDVRDSFTLPMKLPDISPETYQGYITPTSRTLLGQTTNVVLFRDVWQLEFATTGLRQIKLRYRMPDGQTMDRHFWYMVYRVRDFGKSISYEDVDETSQNAFEFIRKELQQDAAKTNPALRADKFMPRFTLEGWTEDNEGNAELKTWRDQYLPEVARQIQKVEDPNVRLYDQQEMVSVEIPLAENDTDPGVWGVAIWEGVDPTLDYVSVFVRGLTNAWRIDPASRYNTKADDISILHKTLQMNFWRPGDSVVQERDMVQYGIPLVDDPAEQVLICRRYRLPGPELNVYLKNDAGQSIFVCGVDGEVSLADFTSPLVTELNGGAVPEALVQCMAAAGLTADGAAVKTEVNGLWWTLEAAGADGPQQLMIRLQPKFWEKKDDGIRFIGTLENFWIYR